MTGRRRWTSRRIDRPLMQKVVREQFERNSPIRIEPFPAESVDVDNSPRLQVVVVSPDREWAPRGAKREMIRDWTQKRRESARDYPAALVWRVKEGRQGVARESRARARLAARSEGAGRRYARQ